MRYLAQCYMKEKEIRSILTGGEKGEKRSSLFIDGMILQLKNKNKTQSANYNKIIW